MLSENRGDNFPVQLNRRTFGLLLGNACLATAICRPRLSAQGALADLPFPKFSRGMNLHHLLNWPDTTESHGKTEYVWPPFETKNYQISDAELTRLKTMGFDFLRVTADPSIFITAKGDRRKQLTDLVLRTINRLMRAGFNVIFDLHPVAVNPDYAPLKLVENIHGAALKGFAEVVEHLARAFNDLPHNKFAFELMNEPWLEGKAGIPRWQPMLELLHQRARKGSPTLPLILTGAAWGDAKALRQLDLKPFADSNVIYTFHYYDPHTYTHQGVQGDEGEYLGGLQWPATHENIVKVQAEAFARIEATKKPSAVQQQLKNMTRKLLSDYELTAHNRAHMRLDFAAVAQWAADHQIPRERIFLGEFGCVISANNVPLGPDRTEWFHAMRATVEEFGFGWALWAYTGYGGMALFNNDGKTDEAIATALELPH